MQTDNMIVLPLIFISSFCPFIFAQFNLYQTDRVNPLEFDCLYYYLGEDQQIDLRYQYPAYHKISYCRRPSEKIIGRVNNSATSTSKKYTLEMLRLQNITADQLLIWSASIDLVEQYALYRSQPNVSHSLAFNVFWNCTSPWFGSQCEYSFDMGFNLTLSDVVKNTFEAKTFFNSTRHSVTNLTCYQFLQCNRGAPMCLDWREVCNGRIDCPDGGADEEHCWQLEMNECGIDEYRCHNGLCIPKAFVNDNPSNPDCVDGSDEISILNEYEACFKDPTFRCEEHTCRPNFDFFSCGDGQCQLFNHSCENNRQKLIEESVLARGYLSDDCWSVMACLTNIDGVKPIVRRTCANLLNDKRNIRARLKRCEVAFQFPNIAVALGHVRFFFFNNRTDATASSVFLPDFICYDSRLCDNIHPSLTYDNLTCRQTNQILKSTRIKEYLTLINSIANYFKMCSSTNSMPVQAQRVLYRCKNSSKFISKHRLLDHIQDCPLGDDETYQESCFLNDTYRFQCDTQKNQCYPSTADRQICSEKRKYSYTKVFFHKFCNRENDFLYQEIDGVNHTDETHCEYWPCSNMYTRCDNYPVCSNGEDEWNCIKSDCPSAFQPCLSPINKTIVCLPQMRVHDGVIDCLGASDEPYLCRNNSFNRAGVNMFRCSTENKCIHSRGLCNSKKDCPSGDDEKFCGKSVNICNRVSISSTRTRNDQIICKLFQPRINSRTHFITENISALPLVARRIERSRDITNGFGSKDLAWSWRCNRGLYARFRNVGLNESYRCFCPPSYYGDFCEFQSQRVSLTLKISTVDRYKTYSFVVRLTNDGGETIDYEQFSFAGIWGCHRSYDIYLLYSSRSKDPLKNYSIHIDAFDRTSFAYWASWYFPIAFPFLPVHRTAAHLTVPANAVSIDHNCPFMCKTRGQCRTYLNTAEHFCQYPANCTGCSSDSICLGSSKGQSICLCPFGKVGPRCLLSASCASERCSKHGQCILFSHSPITNDYICSCSDEFYGVRCELSKRRLDISLERHETAPYILAHIVTTHEQSQPTSEVMIKKRSHDHSLVFFYLREPIHLVFIQIHQNYFFTHIKDISINESSSMFGQLSRCPSVNEILDDTLRILPRIRQIKMYHRLCQNYTHLSCFFDDHYMCLCTSERHANCFEFTFQSASACRGESHCQNGGSCFYRHPTCSANTLCICSECYFGEQCQFYAESFGVTLDDILRYEFRQYLPISEQKLSVIISAIATALMLAMAIVSSLLSLLTFRSPKVRKVGSGLYLLVASIISFFTIVVFNIKFWFLVSSQLDLITNQTILRRGCVIIEPLLKILFYFDNWLKACVAIERSLIVAQGLEFNQVKSKRIARWSIFILPILISSTTMHELIYRDLVDKDEERRRSWCVVHYSASWRKYNLTIVLLHFLAPFFINLSSTIFIILNVARRRVFIRAKYSYQRYLCEQFSEHKHTLISPIILVILSLPRLIISLLSSCIGSSHDPKLYLTAYFISLTPSVLMFVVFVIPSELYKQEFKNQFQSLLKCLSDSEFRRR